MDPNRNRYLASISAELGAQATRMRDLIGDKHWLTDGHHKEYLVAHALRRHMPSGVSVSRGFVTHPRRADLISREQDLLFVDTHAMAPIFHQGGVCVAFPHQVLAALAVKTTFGRTELEDACDTLYSLRRIAAYAGVAPPWCGVLFFEGPDALKDNICRKVGEILRTFEGGVEALTGVRSAPDALGIASVAGFVIDSAEGQPERSAVRGFRGDGTIVLLHGLLAQIARARGSNASELEEFVTGFDMTPLPDSPFSG